MKLIFWFAFSTSNRVNLKPSTRKTFQTDTVQCWVYLVVRFHSEGRQSLTGEKKKEEIVSRRVFDSNSYQSICAYDPDTMKPNDATWTENVNESTRGRRRKSDCRRHSRIDGRSKPNNRTRRTFRPVVRPENGCLALDPSETRLWNFTLPEHCELVETYRRRRFPGRPGHCATNETRCGHHVGCVYRRYDASRCTGYGFVYVFGRTFVACAAPAPYRYRARVPHISCFHALLYRHPTRYALTRAPFRSTRLRFGRLADIRLFRSPDQRIWPDTPDVRMCMGATACRTVFSLDEPNTFCAKLDSTDLPTKVPPSQVHILTFSQYRRPTFRVFA